MGHRSHAIKKSRLWQSALSVLPNYSPFSCFALPGIQQIGKKKPEHVRTLAFEQRLTNYA